jgi:hypothetical protein
VLALSHPEGQEIRNLESTSQPLMEVAMLLQERALAVKPVDVIPLLVEA